MGDLPASFAHPASNWQEADARSRIAAQLAVDAKDAAGAVAGQASAAQAAALAAQAAAEGAQSAASAAGMINAATRSVLASRDPEVVGMQTVVASKTTIPGAGGLFRATQRFAGPNPDPNRLFASANGAYWWYYCYVGPGFSQFVDSTNGNDLNDGLSWDTARKTVIAAYDAIPSTGGTIYVADEWIPGGEVAGQGLRFMHSADPQWGAAGYPGGTNPTLNGWRACKPLRLIGHGSWWSSFLKSTVAYAAPITPSADNPLIWISGNQGQGMEFRNIGTHNTMYRAAALAVPSDRSNAEAWVANLKFEDCIFDLCTTTPDINTGIGPCIEAEHIFWVYFRHCSFRSVGKFTSVGYAPHGLTARQRGAVFAVLCRASQSAYKVYFEHCVGALGGIYWETSGTGWELDVRDFVVEGDFVNPCPASVYLKNLTPYGMATLHNVLSADAPGSEPSVWVDQPGMNPDYVRCHNCGPVRGPATVTGVGQYGEETSTPSTQRQQGFGKRRLIGRHDAARRIGAPAVAPYPNLISTLTPPAAGGLTVTPGQTDPHGRTNAIRYAGNGDYYLVPAIARTIAVGDKILICGWMRGPNGGDVGSGLDKPAIYVELNGSPSPTFDVGGSLRWAGLPFAGEGEWHWVSEWAEITEAPDTTVEMRVYMRLGTSFPLELFAPAVYHVPAAVPLSEFCEWAECVAAAPINAVAGKAYMPGDVPLVTSAVEAGDVAATTAEVGTAMITTMDHVGTTAKFFNGPSVGCQPLNTASPLADVIQALLNLGLAVDLYPQTAAEFLRRCGSPAGWSNANILSIYRLDAASGNETDSLGVGTALVPGGSIAQNVSLSGLPGSKKGVQLATNSTDNLTVADANFLDPNGTVRSVLLVAAMPANATSGNLNVANKFMGGAGWIWRANPVGQIDVVLYPDAVLSGVDTGTHHDDSWGAYVMTIDDVTKHVQMMTTWGVGANVPYTTSPHNASTMAFGSQNGNAQSHRFAYMVVCDKAITQAMLTAFMAPLLA